MTRTCNLALLAAIACTGGDDSDSNPVTECPGLDCRDAISIFVLGVDGSPALSFAGTVTPPDSEPIDFTCTGTQSWFDEGICNEDGSVTLWVYAESLGVNLAIGEDAPYFSGDIAPAWTAPYDSEECGHYCYIALETVQLEPCEGCG